MGSESSITQILSVKNLLLLFAAGICGEIAFEIFAWQILPILMDGRQMQPAKLVMGLANKHLGLQLSYTTGFILHLITGVIIYPLGYVLFRHITNIQSWLVAGLMSGVIIWFLAQGILGPSMRGWDTFMGNFKFYTWASLFAHQLLILTVAFVYEKLTNRDSM